MRLVTWNCCRGSYEKKFPLLEALAPDVAVVQECARPELESDTCIWFGDNVKQGVAIQSAPPYKLTRLPTLERVPKYVVPIGVSGPIEFTMLAVWSQGKQTYSYVEAVVKAVEMYNHMFAQSPTVLIGDLNSNCIWDKTHPRDLNHTALVALLKRHGMVSAYHLFKSEEHGHETTPTFYFHWNEKRPYHIDYCFIPEAWATSVRRVEVGTYEDWRQHSDHRPLLVEIELRVV
ncbi:endonuclease/exonuclease/phosphatase family protein [soil metagenome]